MKADRPKVIAAIRAALGPNAVLIAVAPFGKNPLVKGWQKLTTADMARDEYLATLNHGCNIGVSLGAASLDLCTCDLDLAEALAELLALNPRLADTLQTTRVRGGNLWLQIEGDYPHSGKIKDKNGREFGEWRATGSQTVISGEAIDRRKGETTPTKYRRVSNASAPIRTTFADIIWPDGWTSPWNEPTRAPRASSDGGEPRDRTSKPDKATVQSLLAVIPQGLPHDEWVKVIAAVGDALDDDSAIEVLNEWDAEDESGQYSYKLAHRLDTVTVGTLFHMAKEQGWTGWPEPEPLPPEHPPVEPFSHALLPRSFEPFVRDVCERMQCPPDYVAVGLMVAAGSVVGRKVGIHPKRHDDWLELCNLWGAVVGPPSVMKSPALAEALYPLNKLVAEALKKHEDEVAGFSVSARVGKARKKNEEDEIKKAFKTDGEEAARKVAVRQEAGCEPEPKCRRYVVNDATMEKLGELLNENPNGLLCFRDELAGWLRSMDKDGHENDRAFALECWSGKGAYTYDRIGRGTIRVETAMFGVLGGVQPGVLTEYVSASVSGGAGNDGLIQRFSLLVWPEFIGTFRNIDRWPDKAAKEAVMEVFRALDELTAESVGAVSDFEGIPCLRFTANAQEFFDRWRESFENGLRSSEEHPALVSHFAKYRKLVSTMALLIHLCEGGTGPVPADALTRAVGWQVYLASHARKVYGSVTDSATAAARQIARRIRKGDLKDGFTLREVYRPCWEGLPDARAAGAGAAMLIRLGWLREETRETGGPTVTNYRISPKILHAPGNELTQPTKGGSVSSVSAAPGEWEKNEASPEEEL